MKISWALPAFPTLAEDQNGYLFELYHENSKLFTALAGEQAAQFAVTPFELYLTSRGFRQYRDATRIPLPEIVPSSEQLSDVMLSRRSVREQADALTMSELGTLLRQSLGPTAIVKSPEQDIVQVLRAWPSAGGLYPLDTYVVAARVHELLPGLYHYNILTSELERLSARAPDQILNDGFFWQKFVTSAAVVVLLVAVFERTIAKYGERGYRLVLLDAGHAAQNLLLTAEQLHLNAVAVAGFCDDALATDIGIDGVSEAVVHTVVIGGSHA